MQIIVKNKGLDEWLENVYLAWSAKFPERARMYRDLLQQRKETLAAPSGMSTDGGLRYTAEIPQELFWVINGKIPNFFRDPGNVRKFQEYFMGDAAPDRVKSKFFIDKKEQ